VERAAEDYLIGLRKVYPHASYITINISSPNTKNLRQLQQADELGSLLATLSAEREKLARGGRRVPLALKIAPDLDAEQIESITRLVLEHGMDALIATNTTISRKGVEGLPHGDEAGGLSGAPIRDAATQVQRRFADLLKGRVPIIGSGGVMSAADAQEKFAAGASLVQVYSGLIYRGPALVREIVEAVAAPAKAA
jgi:dihydroorotate dehydrogenase